MMEQPDKRPSSPWTPSQQSPDSFLPPAKRQRLSPTTPSINTGRPGPVQTSYSTAPNVQNFALPNAYNISRQSLPNEYQNSMLGRSTTPMGPPQRPVEKPLEQKEQQEKYMDVNDLSDLVMTSGIDLKQEEELLTTSLQSARSFNAGQASSPQSSYDLLSPNSFGAINGRGTLSQQPERTPEEIIADKHRKVAREYNKRRAAHLDDPFLQGNSMRIRIERVCHDHGVKMTMDGLFDKRPTDNSITGVSMTGSGPNSGGILTAKAPSILTRTSPLEGILSLLSVAANERIRGLLEDSYGIARGRRVTSTGIVPPEWSDIAKSTSGDQEPQPTQAPYTTSMTGTSWDAQPKSAENSQQVEPSIVFPTKAAPLAKSLGMLTKQDRQAEEARIKKRAARKARKNATANNANGDTLQTTGTGLLGEKAPEIKMTKKEREKLAKQDVSEEVATRNANTTAALALGNANKYSWMTSGAKTTPSKPGGFGTPRAGTPGANVGSSGGAKGPSAIGKDGLPPLGLDRKFGVWREDGPGGKDVQLRDWVTVLESDGRDRKTLCYALTKLGKEASQD